MTTKLSPTGCRQWTRRDTSRSTAGPRTAAARRIDPALGTFDAIPRSTSLARLGALMRRGSPRNTGQGSAIPSSADQVGIGASGGRGSIQNPPHRGHAAQNRGVYGLRWYPLSRSKGLTASFYMCKLILCPSAGTCVAPSLKNIRQKDAMKALIPGLGLKSPRAVLLAFLPARATPR